MTPRSTARRGLADVNIAAAVAAAIVLIRLILGRHYRRALFIRKARECVGPSLCVAPSTTDHMSIRLFSGAVTGLKRTTPGQSLTDAADALSQSLTAQPYTGSRRKRNRFGYSKSSSTSSLIELHRDHVLKPEAWRPLLEAVPGVKKVVLHPKGSKESQDNGKDLSLIHI